MASHIGELIGEALALLLLLVLVLLIGKIPVLRKYPLGLHVIGVAIVWIAGAASSAPAGAYLVTLVAIWNYRREVKKPPSGWYRLGAGFSAVWLLLGVAMLYGAYSGQPTDTETVLIFTWTYVALGMAPWLLGWLVHWIRAGFRTKPDSSGAVV
jgi:hypothetical protein